MPDATARAMEGGAEDGTLSDDLKERLPAEEAPKRRGPKRKYPQPDDLRRTQVGPRGPRGKRRIHIEGVDARPRRKRLGWPKGKPRGPRLDKLNMNGNLRLAIAETLWNGFRKMVDDEMKSMLVQLDMMKAKYLKDLQSK